MFFQPTKHKFYLMRGKYFIPFTVSALCLIIFAHAFAQTGPLREQNKREADFIELTKLDKTIKLDIRYATAENFVGRAVYPEARAFLQRPAAEALVRVHKLLKKEGLGIVIFDGYRPWAITKLFGTSFPKTSESTSPTRPKGQNTTAAVPST